MTRTVIMAIALLCMTSCSNVSNETQSASSQMEVPDGVFIHITHGIDNPHQVAMALNMARMMSEDRDVLVYCDIKGIEIVLKESPDIQYAQFPGSREQLAYLKAKGITVAACPGCLEAAGKTEADLAEGVSLANKPGFFNFTEGRILTLDY